MANQAYKKDQKLLKEHRVAISTGGRWSDERVLLYKHALRKQRLPSFKPQMRWEYHG